MKKSGDGISGRIAEAKKEAEKIALELAHEQLNAQDSNIKMTLIRPSSVRTQTFSDPNSISAEQYVEQVLAQQDTV